MALPTSIFLLLVEMVATTSVTLGRIGAFRKHPSQRQSALRLPQARLLDAAHPPYGKDHLAGRYRSCAFSLVTSTARAANAWDIA